LIVAAAIVFATIGYGQDKCPNITHSQRVELATEGGYEFTYQSLAGLFPDSVHCFTYQVKNTPGAPKTDIRWEGNLSNADPFIDGTLPECKKAEKKENCPELNNDTSSPYGRALWPSKLGWGLNKNQYQKKPLAWQNPGSGEKLGRFFTKGEFRPLRSGLHGDFVTHDGKILSIYLGVVSSVEGTGPFNLRYDFRVYGRSSRFVVGLEKERADFPVVVWRSAQSKAFQTDLAMRPLSRRTFQDVPGEIQIGIEKVNELEIVDSLGIAITWRGIVEVLASAPAYRPRE